jgi:hypothetical protein
MHVTAGRQIKDGLAERMRNLKLGIAGVFLSEAQAFRVQAQARAPSDTGALRAGIRISRPTYRQDSADRRYGWVKASVRTKAPYSRLVEFGTIRKSATLENGAPAPSVTGRELRNQQRRASWSRRGNRKLPPINHGSGLAAWAERHGINRWALQKAIGGAAKGRKGGSRPRPFWYPVAISEPARINPLMLAMAKRVFE